ncbi:MAG: sugar transferase, partial [Clostridia bacterium]|nr:sugar transferase [Clostridia bacterium]
EQRRRHDVRPGLTGLAQVNGRNNISWEEKFEWDGKYIEKITLWGDVKIIFKTVGKVLKRSDTVREGTVSDMDFGDWLISEGRVTREEYDEKQSEAKELLKV